MESHTVFVGQRLPSEFREMLVGLIRSNIQIKLLTPRVLQTHPSSKQLHWGDSNKCFSFLETEERKAEKVISAESLQGQAGGNKL